MSGCDVILKDVNVILNGNHILKDISLTFNQGKVVTIIGPNGAGKTTLLRVIAGIIKTYKGDVLICGENLRSGRNIHKMLAYVPTLPNLDPWSRVSDVILIGRYGVSRTLIPNEEDYAKMMEVTSTLGIENLLNRFIGSLSSGELKLVLLAMGLARNPRVFLIDEPLAFLDVGNQSLVMKLLRDLARRGMTVITTSHELHLVPIYSDVVVLLKEGRVVASGSPHKILRKDIVESAYGIRLSYSNELSTPILIPKPTP